LIPGRFEEVYAEAVLTRTMKTARLAVLGVFFLNGFAVASWFVRIPAVQEKLALSEALLGGALLGAAVGALAATLGVGVELHLASVAALTAVAAVLVYRAMLSADVDGDDAGPAFARPTRALAGLGVISFCVLLGEGAMADWSAVYLDGTLGTGPGLAAAGYAVFSMAMAAGRLFGDRLTARFGPVPVVRTGAAVAAAGLGVALAAGHPAFALAGFGCAGAGFSIIFPVALSAAGRTKGTTAGPAIAAVATTGYFGFLVGPPSIGFVAELAGLGGALYLVVALSAAIVFLAGNVGRAKTG
jgi:hypothetical protein